MTDPQPTSFSSTAEPVNATGSLDFGATGGVTLGDFDFQGFEVPAQIAFGGKQQMTVHKLPGGERVVDLMGPDDVEISWSGTFIGDQFDASDPALRAQYLDQLRIAGNPLPLVWGQFYYTVIIENFTADTRYSMVPYKISCLVLANETALPSSPPTVSYTDAVNNDLTSSTDVFPTSDDFLTAVEPSLDTTGQTLAPIAASAETALLTAQTAVAAVGAISAAGSSMVDALAAVTTATTTLAGLTATTEAGVATITAAAGVGDFVGSAAGLTDAVIAAGNMAQLAAAGAYLARVSVNLGGPPWQ